jgi:hypothetical protein
VITDVRYCGVSINDTYCNLPPNHAGIHVPAPKKPDFMIDAAARSSIEELRSLVDNLCAWKRSHEAEKPPVDRVTCPRCNTRYTPGDRHGCAAPTDDMNEMAHRYWKLTEERNALQTRVQELESMYGSSTQREQQYHAEWKIAERAFNKMREHYAFACNQRDEAAHTIQTLKRERDEARADHAVACEQIAGMEKIRQEVGATSCEQVSRLAQSNATLHLTCAEHEKRLSKQQAVIDAARELRNVYRNRGLLSIENAEALSTAFERMMETK